MCSSVAVSAAAVAGVPVRRAAVILRRQGSDVVVAGVVEGSAAAREHAVMKGDVLVEIAGRPVGPDEPPEAVARRLRADAAGAAWDGVAVRLRRPGAFGFSETLQAKLPFEDPAPATEM